MQILDSCLDKISKCPIYKYANNNYESHGFQIIRSKYFFHYQKAKLCNS